MNLIKDNQVTTEDINLAIKAYGPNIDAIKGKITRAKPIPVTSNIIELPDELVRMNEDVVLSIDEMKVNSLTFLTSISHEIYCRTAQCVKDTLAAEYEEKLDEIKAL
eukprot:10486945-Ditylum_brightwellii.AAC.1